MPLLVVAATALELSAALDVKVDGPQGAVVELSAHGRLVLALVTGIGVVNAALELGRALSRPDVTGVVDVGVAGSFDLGAHPVGAVRLVDRECWPEYGLLTTGAPAADAQGLGFALNGVPRTAGDAVFDRLAWNGPAELLAMGLMAQGWTPALSITVSGVTADAARASLLRRHFGPCLENMEGFAAAYGAKRAGLPFAELRAVSNPVGSRPPEGWDLPGALAALGQAAGRLLAP